MIRKSADLLMILIACFVGFKIQDITACHILLASAFSILFFCLYVCLVEDI